MQRGKVVLVVIKMSALVVFAAVYISVVSEALTREPANRTCKDFCFALKNAQRSNRNLTRALEGCCSEATSCVLPASFHKVSCAVELLDECNSDNRSSANLTRLGQLCCGNLSSYGKRKEGEKNRSCFQNISVEWNENENEKKFWFVRDQEPLMIWKGKRWNFLLKMASQMCLNVKNSSIKSIVKYQYPIFIKREYYEKKFVHGFYAPAAYLVMLKRHHNMIIVLGESAKHLWLTVSICITWTLISGVIIWLLVSYFILSFDK